MSPLATSFRAARVDSHAAPPNSEHSSAISPVPGMRAARLLLPVGADEDDDFSGQCGSCSSL